jgi:HK97 family phage portal protein
MNFGKWQFGRLPWRVFDKKSSTSLALPDAFTLEIFGRRLTISSQDVNPATAMSVPAVKAAVELISTTVGTLPAKIFERGAEGGKTVASAHPAYGLVHDDVNDWTSAGQLRALLTADALLHGNGYAYAVRVGGRVRELIRLDPRAVTVEVDDATGEPRYRVAEGSTQRLYAMADVLHVAAPFSHNGITGVSVIEHAREAIGLALVLERHAARLFGNGARPSGVLSVAGRLTTEAAQRLAAAWKGSHAGDSAGGTAVLEDGATFLPITFNSVDAQFAEMRTFQIVEVARAFRVPPSMLYEMGRATWSNAETANREFLQHSLLPWLRAWEAAYRRLLLSPEERTAFSVEFVVDDLLRADTAQRATAYSQFRAAGVMTANEVRALENLPPLPGGDVLANPYTSSSTGPTK